MSFHYVYIYWEKIVLGYDHMKFNYFDKTLLNHEYHDDLCHYIYFKKYIFLFIFLAWRKRDFGCWLRQTSLMPILIKFCQFQFFFSFFCKVFYHLRRRLYLFWWKAAFILKFKWRTCWWMMILASSFLFFFFFFLFNWFHGCLSISKLTLKTIY